MRGSGGTEGGVGAFTVGLLLACVSLYLFFDSVHVTSQGFGLLTTLIHTQTGGGFVGTASMGVVFFPFFIGVVSLFVNAKQTWAWVLMWSGLGILVIEILSRISFLFNLKASHLLILLAIFAAGVGLMLRSYRHIEKAK